MTLRAFGHRGARALAPENTLAGFRMALELGVDGVELDVHLSADGHVVVMHDAEVARTTNGKGAVRKLSLEQLRALDAGGGCGSPFGGERIPLLEEVLALAKGRGRVAIELKEESPEALGPTVDLVRRLGMQRECSLLSFSPGLMEEARRLGPEIERELIVVMPIRQVARARAVGAGVLDLPDLFVTRGVLERARDAGLLVGAGITNDERTMRRLAAAGVDILYTDRPDLLLRVLADMGLRPAAQSPKAVD
ncbi:MAG: glycerophosphodiester phosphodiesterase [Candidatus Wallbacteria bacterium]|nr:glycerophosphodiester phosphodiesterase [Candidatus Wallbacteria bacterium]